MGMVELVRMPMRARVRASRMLVEAARKALGQFARLVIVDIDQCGDAPARACDFDRGPLQAAAGKTADRL
jgi:hypothetical protein